MKKTKCLLFWSGGKDSALALHIIKENQNYDVLGLVTILNRDTSLVPRHGIPDSLVIEQAKMIKLPLQRVFVESTSTPIEYAESVRGILAVYAKRGIKDIIFGDSHQLEDKIYNRTFKEAMLAPLEMNAHFPLWDKKAREISLKFILTEHKALVTAIDLSKLDNSFLACEFNREYLDKVDDRNDFHTFVTFGPQFKMRVAFSKAIAHQEGDFLVSSVKEP